MMTPEEEKTIWELRNELTQTIGLYCLLYEGKTENYAPYDRMVFEIDFATKSLRTAQTVLSVINSIVDRHSRPPRR